MKVHITLGKNLRADSAWVLYQVLEEGRSTRELLPRVHDSYSSPQDRNWLNETVLGVLRTLPTLQLWLRPRLKKPLKGTKKIIEHLLMVGLYQLHFMRVSEHAAVNETVGACAVLKAHGLKNLVNAILRDAQRSELTQPDNPLIASGLPKWIYSTIQENYPDKAAHIIENMNAKAPIWLRINSHKTTTEAYCEKLSKANIDFVQSNVFNEALIVRNANVTSLPGFEQGLFAVQDGAAQHAAHLLQPQANDHILDCCSAPGGKACHLFSLVPTAKITALDSSAERLERVYENAQRLGCELDIVTGDAANPDNWWNKQQFDKILLDAPCSATGVIRRHPDIRWLRKATDIDVLVNLQAEILDSAWSMLKPGGTLLYATCSILPKENNQQIDRFLATTENAHRDMQDIQILPGDQQMDGFYYARLIKSG